MLLCANCRQLNPMYEGYLQHDAQEVLQCILAYIQEASDTIKKELRSNQDDSSKTSGETDCTMKNRTGNEFTAAQDEEEGADGQLSGKRKSDTEAGNAKKKPKSQSKPKNEEENKPFTRSKRKSSGEGTSVSDQKEKEHMKEGSSNTEEEKSDGTPKEVNKRKKRAKLSWLKSSGKQPSIFSKFRSMGRISSHVGDRPESQGDHLKTCGDGQEKAILETDKPTENPEQAGARREGISHNKASVASVPNMLRSSL